MSQTWFQVFPFLYLPTVYSIYAKSLKKNVCRYVGLAGRYIEQLELASASSSRQDRSVCVLWLILQLRAASELHASQWTTR